MTRPSATAPPEKVKVKLFAPVDDEFDRILRRSNRWAAATALFVVLCAVGIAVMTIIEFT